ncbi:hypothetical protein [Escherichia coli]|uniref:hypothetical protein n=1 Tax=Escherichia coli TaxID=562 RepID=UPI0017843E43|nr:hypothetical protein [Escherichia coli]MCI3731839.1 hypothetical protein [Escherichia coli]MCK2357448.1 hypothetical protein [Escherichia coli]MCV5578264.1 hypothetical protein [Escherichia coli]
MNNKNTFTGDKLSHAIKIALSGVVCSLLFVLPVHAVEFNVDMIDVEDRENIVDWPHESPDNQYHLNK